MKFKIIVLLGINVLLFTILLNGCSAVSAGNTVAIGGSWDMLSLVTKIGPVFMQKGPPVKIQFSADAIKQLKAGELDAVILGREPSATEMIGLADKVVAYDAICIIIDENSFQGGISMEGPAPVGRAGPFNRLSKEDAKGLFGYWTAKPADRWLPWNPYFAWSNLNYSYKFTLKDESQLWELHEKPVVPWSKFMPGKYDTQTHLFADLGLDEKEVSRTWNNQYSNPDLSYEEEVLSAQYTNGPYAAGTGDFQYKLGFCSRRVAQIALQHIPIKVIPVDGIDPLTNSSAVYDGSYAFSRRVHVIVRENGPRSAGQFAAFLLSEEGQQQLVKIGYLPIKPN